MDKAQGHMLVVEDDFLNRTLLVTNLEEEGYEVTAVENGLEALEALRTEPFDVVLLDIEMPVLDGYATLDAIKQDVALQHIPVIMISSLDDLESVIRCIKMGATDYLPKPFDPALLHARLNASLVTKRMRDMEKAHLKQIQAEQEKSERLLLNILPRPIAERLKQADGVIADSFADVTVLFADLVGFTELASRIAPQAVIHLLDEVFSCFDRLVEQHGLEKIKTIGDAYMVAGGLPVPRPDHVTAVADLALDMRETIITLNAQRREQVQVRIGLHSGPVVAGIIGTKKFSYDLWGDTVNTASRMESHGVEGAIHVSDTVYQRLNERYVFSERGVTEVKGKGAMMTYLLIGKKTM